MDSTVANIKEVEGRHESLASVSPFWPGMDHRQQRLHQHDPHRRKNQIKLGRSWDRPTLVGEEVYPHSLCGEGKSENRSGVKRLESRFSTNSDLLDGGPQTLNVGGIGSSSGGMTGQSKGEIVRHGNVAEGDLTPEQEQSKLLKQLVEQAYPNITGMSNQ